MRYRVTRVTHDKEVIYVDAECKALAIEVAKNASSALEWDLVLDDATTRSPTYEVEDP